MTAFAALERASSGQIRFQSSGIKSQRMTSRSVAASMAAQCSTGTGLSPDRICDRYEGGMPTADASQEARPRLAVHQVLSSMHGTIAMQKEESKHCEGQKAYPIPYCSHAEQHDSAMHLGERLKALMKARGIKTGAMAAHCGVTVGAVSNWFATGRISKTNLVKAAAMLDVSVEDLIAGTVGERGQDVPEPSSETARWQQTARNLAQASGPMKMTPAAFLQLVDSIHSQNLRQNDTGGQTELVRQLLDLVLKQDS